MEREMRSPPGDVRTTVIEVAVTHSPLGPIHVAGQGGTLSALSFDDAERLWDESFSYTKG